MTRDPQSGTSVDFVGPDFIYGDGRVNAARALLMVRNGDYLEGSLESEGDEVRQTFNVPNGLDSWNVNLTWDDPPGAEDINASTLAAS